MIPIYFTNKSERSFTSGGKLLVETISCKSKWNEDGVYEAELEYAYPNEPIDFECEQWVCIKTYDDSGNQPFFIYKIEWQLNGIVVLYLRHASYLLKGLPFNQPFNFYTYIPTFFPTSVYTDKYQMRYWYMAINAGFTVNDSLTVPRGTPFFTLDTINAREFLLDKKGYTVSDEMIAYSVYGWNGNKKGGYYQDIKSFTDVDILFDKFKIYIKDCSKNLGEIVSYGYNMTNFKKSVSIENVVTTYVPYYSYKSTVSGDDGEEDSKHIDRASYAPVDINNEDCDTFTNKYCEYLDITGKFSSQETEYEYNKAPDNDSALSAANGFISAMTDNDKSKWKASKNVEVGFIPNTITTTPFNKVVVIHNPYMFACTARLVDIEYDCLGEKCLNGSLSDLEEIETCIIWESAKDMYFTSGDVLNLFVKASGKDLTYQWQYSDDNGVTWTNNTRKVSSFDLTASNSYNGRLFRCEITDSQGNKYYSDECKLIKKTTLSITTQPTSKELGLGDANAELSCVASGDEVKYTWECLNGTEWVPLWTENNKYIIDEVVRSDAGTYRCKAQDIHGNVIYSNEITVTVVNPLRFSVQPEDGIAREWGDVVVLSVSALGDGIITYQWQHSKYEDNSFIDIPGETKKQLSFTYDVEPRYNYFRCKATNGTETVYSEVVTTYYKPYLAITKQPNSINAWMNKTVSFSVEAQGEGTRYTWQYSENGTDWIVPTDLEIVYTNSSISFALNENNNKPKWRCVIEDSYDQQVTSDIATITVIEKPNMIYVSQQPQNASARNGENVTLSVVVTNETSYTLAYQWEWSTNGNTWSSAMRGATGLTSDTVVIPMNSIRNGYLMRCTIRTGSSFYDESGNKVASIYTEPCTITMIS